MLNCPVCGVKCESLFSKLNLSFMKTKTCRGCSAEYSAQFWPWALTGLLWFLFIVFSAQYFDEYVLLGNFFFVGMYIVIHIVSPLKIIGK